MGGPELKSETINETMKFGEITSYFVFCCNLTKQNFLLFMMASSSFSGLDLGKKQFQEALPTGIITPAEILP